MGSNREAYRELVKALGKKEFTLQKMQEYGFWPKDLPTPYEKQQSETEEEYKKREELTNQIKELTDAITEAYGEKDKLVVELRKLNKKLDNTWDYEMIRKDVASTIMQESIARRKAVKEEKARLAKEKSEAWQKHKSNNIVFVGKGYSSRLSNKETSKDMLEERNMPVICDNKQLAEFLGVDYKTLRYLTYHRDVVKFDNYVRYDIPKKKGGVRHIAAPKSNLKQAQRKILDNILQVASISDSAHGFINNKSVVTGAAVHGSNVSLLINMDLENFFPTIDFKRVVGMFESFGYSGYVATLLSMICTYCERMEMEVKGEKVYVKTTDRILPQGAPSSPMITNIICNKLDNRLNGLAKKYGFTYSRYADDMRTTDRILPQGAPSSPMITNIICNKLDNRLNGLAKKYGFTYSRYADDMSFSFNENNEILANSIKTKENALVDKSQLTLGKLLGIINRIIREEGFIVNEAKTKFLRSNNRQEITGIVINNNEIGVPRPWIKRLRAAIHNANKEIDQSGKLSEEKYNEIKGKLSWLKCVNAERYANIIEQGYMVLSK